MNDIPDPTPEQLAQNPLLMILLLGLTGLFFLYISGFFISWGFLIYRHLRGLATLTVLPWQPRKWSGFELFLAVVSVVLCQIAGVAIWMSATGMSREELQSLGDENLPLSLAALVAVVYLVACALITIWICLRYRVTPTHVGWTHDIVRVLKVGIVASLAIVPIIFALNALVASFGGVEYEHPLIEAMQSEGSAYNFLYAVIAAAIGAPLAEEFLFRGLLQGWLQSIPFRSMSLSLIGIDTAPSYESSGAEASVQEESSPGPREPEFVAEPSHEREAGLPTTGTAATSQNPYSIGEIASTGHGPNAAEFLTGSLPNVIPPIWPSAVAGLLFGLAHWGYGLSWIPLSIFGFALGLLYRATHSIWPSVIVHFAMNGTSMYAMGVIVYMKNVLE